MSERKQEQPVAVLFMEVCDYGYRLGVRSISKLPGLWEQTVDEHWKIRLNPHKDEIDDVPPFSVAVEFNGWPAGIFNAGGGCFAAGSLANEETFIESLHRSCP